MTRLTRQACVSVADDSDWSVTTNEVKGQGQGRRKRRASCDEVFNSKSNFELRRCRSEVSAVSPRVDDPADCGSGPADLKPATARNAVKSARELRTLKLHYYPEGGWGWVVLFCATLCQCVVHGILLATGTLLPQVIKKFANTWTTAVSAYNLTALPSSALQPSVLIHYNKATNTAFWRYGTPVAGSLSAVSLCVSLAISPVVVAWCRRKSTRLTAVLGGLVAALALLFTSFATQFHQLFLSYGIILGIGAGLTRDTATLMVGQYFKRRREAVEIALVGASGLGLALMAVILYSILGAIGWRLGLQAVTGLVLVTFLLGSCYRSASLYHPQRRAILHLKNQRKKVKEKNKRPEDRPPFFDFGSLKSRTIQIILMSTTFIATGLYTPLVYMSYEAAKDSSSREGSLWLQVYMGFAWTLGCILVGLLIVREPAECKIARQYLCQAAGLLTGLALLSQAAVSLPGGSSQHGLFAWVYGIGLGSYHYTLKMFVYQKVRARNFARAWGFIQGVQAIPVACGVPLAGYLASEYGEEASFYFSGVFIIVGSVLMFLIDIRKYFSSRSHSHKHRKHRRKCNSSGDTESRPRTPGGAGTNDGGFVMEIDADLQAQDEACPPSCKGRVRKDSLAEDVVGLPPLALLQQTSLVLAELGELPCAAAAELTCISEEGIADMDIPDHLLEELEYAADCITSCDKVENFLMLSEFENNLSQQNAPLHSERKARKWSLFKQFSGNGASRNGHGTQHKVQLQRIAELPQLNEEREPGPSENIADKSV